MTYKKERKKHFRLSEERITKRKRGVPFATKFVWLLSAIAPLTWASQETNLTEAWLSHWVNRAYEDEVASIASARQWPAYQLNYKVRVPAAVTHLPVCQSELTISGRDHQSLPIGNLKRSIACLDNEKPWRINVTIRSTITLPVVVVQTPIERNQPISVTALKLEQRTLNHDRLFLNQLSEANGYRAIRRLRTGQVLTLDHLEAIPLVMKGNEVVLTATQGGFRASMKGIALEEGSRGEQIEVRNLSSGKVVRAQVTGTDQVQTRF